MLGIAEVPVLMLDRFERGADRNKIPLTAEVAEAIGDVDGLAILSRVVKDVTTGHEELTS